MKLSRDSVVSRNEFIYKYLQIFTNLFTNLLQIVLKFRPNVNFRIT